MTQALPSSEKRWGKLQTPMPWCGVGQLSRSVGQYVGRRWQNPHRFCECQNYSSGAKTDDVLHMPKHGCSLATDARGEPVVEWAAFVGHKNFFH